ncbi:MAG: hypothetical protein QXS23_05190 [Desulfurococcaceae archaeon]
MSIASRANILGKFISLFKTRDPVRKSIFDSIALLERMIRTLESSKRSLEVVMEEHKKRVKTSGGDKELIEIIDEETRNVSGYLALLTKVVYDLARVRYRLETLAYVEEPIKILPEVLDELRKIEPEIEKINPQLISQIKTIEQKVSSILITSSSDIIPHTSISKKEITESKDVKTIQESMPSEKVNVSSRTLPAPPPEVVVSNVDKTTTQQVAIPIPQEQKPGIDLEEVPLNVIEQWLLDELRTCAGILDVQLFERKYRVKRENVYKALKSLEDKGLIKIKRR